jgi:hypothetical protein
MNIQIFPVLLLLTALLISGIAGYFSIVGLTLIFSAAFWPIVIMGTALELGKLVAASFVYRMWHKINFIIKTYFVISVIILSAITSLGIFGYLSKSYTADSAALYNVETKIDTATSILEVEKRRLDNLLLQQSQRQSGVRRIERDINNTQDKISKLTLEIGELRKTRNEQNSEIGPIRYISELFYQKNDLETIDKSVRIIIVILITVFDPLAILLIIAANMLMHTPRMIRKPDGSIEIGGESILNISEKDINI